MELDLIQLLASSLRLVVPMLLAAMAGLFAERSGLIDIGLEGKMLAGAFVGGAAASLMASPWLGLAAAVVAGGMLGLAQGVASISLRGNQLVIGLAINIIASGLTAFLGIAWFQRGGQTPQLSTAERFGAVRLPFADALADIPVLGPLYNTVIGGQTFLGYAAIAAVAIAWIVIYRTRFGLRLMAAGDNPAALDSAGVSVIRLRYTAILIGGALCGAAGAYLSIVQGGAFYRDMSAGLGFMALAALIFGGWRPYRVALACLLFAAADAVQGRLQGQEIFGVEAPTQVVQAIPYVLTILLLAGLVGHAEGPAAAGRPYIKGQR